MTQGKRLFKREQVKFFPKLNHGYRENIKGTLICPKETNLKQIQTEGKLDESPF